MLSTLSASIVGVGDALGEIDRANLNRVIRADGVIVKPDDAITPLDATYIEQANDRRLPIVAAAHTRHQRSITSYVFAFGQPAEQRTARLSPSALGHKGPVYAYNYFDGYGMHLQPGQAVEFAVPDDGACTGSSSRSGPSGVGSLGDGGKFVSNGRKRVARIMDTGVYYSTGHFFRGRTPAAFLRFSLARPKVRAAGAIIAELALMIPERAFFTSTWLREPGTSPVVTLRAAVNPKTARSVIAPNGQRAGVDGGHQALELPLRSRAQLLDEHGRACGWPTLAWVIFKAAPPGSLT